MQSGLESFNGDCATSVSTNTCSIINEARNTVEEWRIDYNTNRPHSSLKWAHTNRLRNTPRGGA